MSTPKIRDPLSPPAWSIHPLSKASSEHTVGFYPWSELHPIQKWVKEITDLKDCERPKTQQKNGQSMNQTKIQMDLKLVKIRSTTLMKEMQIKTNSDTNFHQSDWQRSNGLIPHRVGEDVLFTDAVRVNGHSLPEGTPAVTTGVMNVCVPLPATLLPRIHTTDTCP